VKRYYYEALDIIPIFAGEVNKEYGVTPLLKRVEAVGGFAGR